MEESFAVAATLVDARYVEQGKRAIKARQKLVKSILSQRRLPLIGLDETGVELFVQEVALMDSNNFVGNVGVGEREARVACLSVSKRHYRLAHGVGRSGDIAAVQPKAAGSSLLAKLTNLLAMDALRIAGLEDIEAASVLPLATGMALSCTLLAIKRQRPAGARYVLWPRIDQKTCAKCVAAAGFELVVIPNTLEGDQLRTDLGALRREVDRLGPANIVAVLSTTSCFAPRAADRLVEVAKLCREAGVAHVVNNAYGVQARQLTRLISSAWRKGRVDAVVQSTDKNFMVPVGGSTVAAGPGAAGVVDAVNAAYPGRASASPMLDLLMTLLHWGADGWRRVLQEREDLWPYANKSLADFAAAHGCRVLSTPDNPISIAMSLEGLSDDAAFETARHAVVTCGCDDRSTSKPVDREATRGYEVGSSGAAASGTGSDGPLAAGVPERDGRNGAEAPVTPVTLLGSMLFHRLVSGARVVARGKVQAVEGASFRGYGAHHDSYPCDYLTVAVALGTTRKDFDEFIVRLEACFRDFKKQRRQEPHHTRA